MFELHFKVAVLFHEIIQNDFFELLKMISVIPKTFTLNFGSRFFSWDVHLCLELVYSLNFY